MTRMIEITALALATAVAAANLTTTASAQAFSAGWGTGNVEAAHYDAAGHLVRDAASQNVTTTFGQGLSAFASAPRPTHRRQAR